MRTYTDPGKPAVIGGRRTRNFVCLVDAYRAPHMKRNTAGRYRVGAKNPKQARKLLQRTIGFGSVQVFCEDNGTTLSDIVPMGTCVRETWNKETERFDQAPARHASRKNTTGQGLLLPLECYTMEGR